MKTIRNAVIPLIAVLLFSILTPPASAEAAPAGVPITCGMRVQDDARLYLAEDLQCPTYGVLLEQHRTKVPTIDIDLRGHTLRGPGLPFTGYGITGFNPDTYPGPVDAHVQVRNGRLANWNVAISSGTDFRVRNVAFVDNRVGFQCFGSCHLDRSYLTGNYRAGLEVVGDYGGAHAVVTRTLFVKNVVGALVNSRDAGLTISTSVFLRNEVGTQAASRVTVSRSLFVKNGIGLLVLAGGTPGPGDIPTCAALNKVKFVGNVTNIDGPRC
jgi:hypothetical protein